MEATEEILGQFLGDDAFPVTWASETEKDLFWVYDDLHIPHPRQPDVLRHRRLVAELRPHVPPVRDAVRRRLAGQERQRLRLHDRGPGRSRPADRRHGVQRPLRRPRAARRRVRRRRWARTSTPSCPSTARTSPTGGATAWCPRCSATSPILEERLDAADGMSLAELAVRARGRDRHPRPPLEDPLDAQLRPAVGDAQPAGGDGADARRRRRGAAGPAPELGLGPQLGLDRGAVADEERGPRRRRAAHGVRAPATAPRSPPRCGRRTAAGGSSPSGSSRTSASSAGTPSGATSSSSRPCASRWSRCSSWSATTSTATTTTRPRSRRCGATSRPPRARSSTASSGEALEEMRAANEINLRMAPLTPDHHFYIDQGANAHVRLVLMAIGRKLVEAGAARRARRRDVPALQRAADAHRRRRRGRCARDRRGRAGPSARRRPGSSRATGSGPRRRPSSRSRTSSTGATRSGSTGAQAGEAVEDGRVAGHRRVAGRGRGHRAGRPDRSTSSTRSPTATSSCAR